MVFRASLLSSGGLANLPALHEDLTHAGWATERDFGESIAIGQVAPGPNGLWVVSLGYLLNGARGAALATLGILLPPFLVLLSARLYERVRHLDAVDGFMRGLLTVVSSIFFGVMLKLVGASPSVVSATVITIAAYILAARKAKIPLILLAAALVGIGLHRL